MEYVLRSAMLLKNGSHFYPTEGVQQRRLW